MVARRVACLLAALLVGTLARPAGQQQDERYRTTLNLVSIYATVTDESGRLVTDLTKDEFVVKDNGRKQPLAVFNNNPEPISVVILLDCSGSMADEIETVRAGASEFIKRMRPDDRGRIGTFATDIEITPAEFTGDTQTLLSVVSDAGMRPGAESQIWKAVDRSITALLKQGGRRVILIFTDGKNNPPEGRIPVELKDIIWRARVDDVMVYSIGFIDNGDRKQPFIALPGSRQGGYGGVKIGGGSSREAKAARQSLQELSAQTGGGYLEMTGLEKLREAFARVADELHRQYWLGFKPAKLDDTMHKLDVSVTRRGVTVQARKTYFAGSFVK
jgi:Ca-activated chloride channel family protein